MNNGKLQRWLQYSLEGTSTDKMYRLVLLEENPLLRCEILGELKQYIHEAHEDFRRYYRELLRCPLNPFEEHPAVDLINKYPGILDMDTLKGYFGEVFAAIVAQFFSPFGIDDWEVPAFLFRNHRDAFNHILIMNETGREAGTIPGRTGDDFLAFQRDGTGRIRRILYCEAKCNREHRSDSIGNAFEKVGQPVIVDLSQIITVLKDQQTPAAQQWIYALQIAQFSNQYERCNLVSYICGDRPKHKRMWLPKDSPHEKYTSQDILEAVETHLDEIETFVREVYPLDGASGDTMQPDHKQDDNAPAISDREVLELAADLRRNLAGSTFPRTFSKLYSQHTRLEARQPGLLNWTEAETQECLDDAIRLIEAALTERDGGNKNWQEGTRRAGEILEWLSHPRLNSEGLPTRLLSAAAYQLAGYPAMSTGILNTSSTEAHESQILKYLLKADFPRLLTELAKYWAQTMPTGRTDQHIQWDSPEELNTILNLRIVKETMGALGIFCASMRWGDEPRMYRAVDKMKSIGNLLLHSYDPYSWLLARLCAEVAVVYDSTSKRHNLLPLSESMSKTGQTALERYLRQCYYYNKSLAWPSQVKGIEKLLEGKSFALCTPTGSGKTSIAELAILQSLFTEPSDGDNTSLLTNPAPLVIYLVPSRALAAEVESALTRVLKKLNEPPIIVTGLYGGTDWGPTDAWLTSTDQTVLICTPEKAEALIRFLGPHFLKRVSLLVVDEAHSVQFDPKIKNATKKLQEAENRPLRLEALCSRLFTYLDGKQERIIALSAVARGIERPLTEWVTGQPNAEPTESTYHSTRQLIGKLEYLHDRRFIIKYDLLDGANLKYLENKKTEQPYIPDPVPQLPHSEDYGTGPEIQVRPYLFWAAIHMAAQGEGELQHSVLISVTQHINTFAKEFLNLLEKTWANIPLPIFFQPPQDKERAELWENCLLTCADYFGKDSHEYKLLERGIVVHHGRMPGRLARLLTDAVQDHIVYLVIATSTLSEGVNLPFQTILIPSLLRGNDPVSEREFVNLAGRAGRPGYGTEGRTLVLYDGSRSYGTKRYRDAYDNLVKSLQAQGEAAQNVMHARSPLAELLDRLEVTYRSIPGVGGSGNFQQWLQQTEPLKIRQDLDEYNGLNAIETLDTIDSLLLSCIVEAEQLAKEEISADSMEERLREIWQRSYAHYASQEEKHLQEIFLTRGRALKERIYPTARWRKKMYHTSLPPRHGNLLIELFPSFKRNLEKGREYARWDQDTKLGFIQDLAAELTSLPKYKLSKEQINKVSWRKILQWWLNPTSATYKTPDDISSWYEYVSNNFGYRFNWGLGSIVALAADEALGEGYLEPSLENWPLLELPWIALWLKELIIWGTLEPVAAYLLSKNMEYTREGAESAAKVYLKDNSTQEITDELLNPYAIREWATRRYYTDRSLLAYEAPENIAVKLTQDFSKLETHLWRVLPVQIDKTLNWFDPSGTLLATSGIPSTWSDSYLVNYDFKLDPNECTVSPESYLTFRQ